MGVKFVRLWLAIKLYTLHRITTGTAARIAGISRVGFILELGHLGLSPFGQEAHEIADDFENA